MEIKKENKKGVFFSIDALIAVAILFLFMLIAIPIIKENRTNTEIHYDVLTTLSSLKVGDMNTSYVKSLIGNNTITDVNKNLLEQIGEFYVKNKTLAKEFSDQVLSTLDTKENIGIWFGNDSNSKLVTSKNSSPYENAKNIDTIKQEITGIQEANENVTGYAARAFLSKALQSKYFYLGGYVGDGNISLRVEYHGNISSAVLETAINSNFTVYVNNQSTGFFNKSTSDAVPSTYIINTSNFDSGINIIELKSSVPLYVSGGFLRINYLSDVEYPTNSEKYYFPGISGTINLYDSFYAPSIDSMNIYLHYNSSQESFLNIGNVTVFNTSYQGLITQSIDDTQIRSLINYSSIINNTVPIRMGLFNISFSGGSIGNADIVLITDVSGSMDWRLDQDSVSGTARNCNDVNLNAPSTKRISLAKCLDKNFIANVTSYPGNRIALVTFDADALARTNLTSNTTFLNNTVNSFTTGSGTCYSCGINMAYEILKNQSDPSRPKYIIAMTDGVTNYRSTPTCDSNSISYNDTSAVQVGNTGTLLIYDVTNDYWNPISTNIDVNLNDVDLLNTSLGFVGADSGRIYKYNGSSLQLQIDLDPTASNRAIYGVDIYNASLGFGVVDNGWIYRYNGTNWTRMFNGSVMNAVELHNSSLGFAVGTSGRIYKYNGTNWTLNIDVGSTNLYNLNLYNATLGFAAGTSGRIYKYNGTNWTLQVDLGSMIFTDVHIVNSTLGFAVADDSRIYRYNGTNWTSFYTASYDLSSIRIFNETLGFAVGQTLAQYIKWNISSYARNYYWHYYEGNSTIGKGCNDNDACSLTTSIPMLNANYSSCRAHNELNSTVYAVGVGPIQTCGFGNIVLTSVASCGNGSFLASDNATLLQQFYGNIASTVLSLSYSEQISSVQGNFSSVMYPDSFIEMFYTKPSNPLGIILNVEQRFSDNQTGNFTIPSDSTLIDAYATSYSGSKWTYDVTLNNRSIYKSSDYNKQLVELGDPYVIRIPNQLINLTIPNSVRIRTASNLSSVSNGSEYNKIVYKIAKNISSYTGITSHSSGCTWNIEFEDNTLSNYDIPENYVGSNRCFYNSTIPSTHAIYDDNDAIQLSSYYLLTQLDIDDDGRIDINLPQEFLQIVDSSIQGIPYSWKTEVSIRVWS